MKPDQADNIIKGKAAMMGTLQNEKRSKTTYKELVLTCLFFVFSFSLSMISAAADTPKQSADDLGYVKADTCVGCHQTQKDKWSHSDHAWAMKPANEQSVLGDFNNTVFDDGAVQARFFQHDDEFRVAIEGESGEQEEFTIAYTFGFFPLQQYLVELSRGRLQALTIAWDSRTKEEGGQRWFSLYPGQKFAPDDALHWTGRYQNWNAMCADCHSTALTMDYEPKTDSFSTTWQEQNVGCQGCHGPGRDHLKWAQNNTTASGIKSTENDMGLTVDFNGMAPEKLVETCAYCHSSRQSLKDGQHAYENYLDKALPSILSSDLYHPDGQIQGEVYVYGSFIQSKMYKAGVSCLNCHDPHTTELVAEGNALCTQCHNQSLPSQFSQIKPLDYDSPEHHHHSTGSAGAQCVNCHMPETTYMVVDPRRDHSFRIPRPDLTVATGSPNACTDCHADRSAEWAKTAIDEWYPHTDETQHFAGSLSAFRNAENGASIRLAELIRDRSSPAIARATAAEHLGSLGRQGEMALRSGLLSEEPLVQAYSAGAFATLPVSDKVQLLTPLLSPEHPLAVRDEALNALAGTSLNQFPKEDIERIRALRQDYEKRLKSLAALPGSRFKLALYFHRDRQYPKAIEHYQATLAIDPTFTPARINLATLASNQGNTKLSILTLKAGAELETIPDSDRSHLDYLLALVLVEQNRSAEALGWFEEATRLDHDNTRAAYNHGLVLAKMNRFDKAYAVLKTALERHPKSYDLLNATIYVLHRQGQLSKALSYAQILEQTFPEDPNAGAIVRKLKTLLSAPN